MNKREFLIRGAVGLTGLFVIPSIVKAGSLNHRSFVSLPDLTFSYSALEPIIDKKALEYHHKHIHGNYTNELNSSITKLTSKPKSIRDILLKSDSFNHTTINQSAAYINHRLYWRSISPDGGSQPIGNIGEAIFSNFGSYENFKNQFSEKALETEQGWVWLILQNDQLKIISTAENNNPLMNTLPSSQRGIPLLTIDLWNHAYNSSKAEYVNSYWQIISWKNAERKFNKFYI